jgi:hypothetical protein
VIPVDRYVYGNPEPFRNDTGDENVFIHDHTDKEFAILIDKIAEESKKEGLDWFIPETKKDQSEIIKNLRNAYQKNYLGNQEEGHSCVPDDNGQIVAEAIRLRLMSGAIVGEEFDSTLGQEETEEKKSDPEIFNQEVEIIRNLDKDGRIDLVRKIRYEIGYEIVDGVEKKIGHSRRIRGFAIDPLTFEYLISFRSGDHFRAHKMLEARILQIATLKYKKYSYSCEKLEKLLCARIIRGLLIDLTESFRFPILYLSNEYDELFNRRTSRKNLRRICQHVLNDYKFIPVDVQGNLITG